MGNIPTQNQSSPIFLSDLSVVRIPRYFVLTKQLLALETLRLTLKISFISQVVILLFPLPTTKISVVLELHHWDTYAVTEVWVVNFWQLNVVYQLHLTTQGVYAYFVFHSKPMCDLTCIYSYRAPRFTADYWSGLAHFLGFLSNRDQVHLTLGEFVIILSTFWWWPKSSLRSSMG
jgi:hypothetical protein